MTEREVSVSVVIDGQDETTGQTVRARKAYYLEDLRFAHRYLDILDVSDDRHTVLDYRRFHLTQAERVEAPAADTSVREAVSEIA